MASRLDTKKKVDQRKSSAYGIANRRGGNSRLKRLGRSSSPLLIKDSTWGAHDEMPPLIAFKLSFMIHSKQL